MSIYDPNAHARRTDPDTSHEAARLVRPGTMLRLILLAHLLEGPMTADEVSAYCLYDETHQWAQARKRISDLMNAGYLADTGDRRPGRSGRLQMVREITNAGRKALE